MGARVFYLVLLQSLPFAMMQKGSTLPEQIHMAFGKPASTSVTISWCTNASSRFYFLWC